MQALWGYPCSSRCLYIHVHIDSTKWAALNGRKYYHLVSIKFKMRGGREGGQGREGGRKRKNKKLGEESIGRYREGIGVNGDGFGQNISYTSMYIK